MKEELRTDVELKSSEQDEAEVQPKANDEWNLDIEEHSFSACMMNTGS